MLTVDFDRLDVGPGLRLLDVGCGAGRHALEAARRGATTVAVDRGRADCQDAAGRIGPEGGSTVNGDGLALPFPDRCFDRIIAAEVLEHVPDDRSVLAELVRVLRPGGRIAVTVPRWFPEQVCWALADDYHAPAVAGGHVRIYRRRALRQRMADAGLRWTGAHHAHALHAPYWWLRCAVGVGNGRAAAVRLYHRLLVWDMLHPGGAVHRVEWALNPVLGKSLVVYAVRPC